jgi:lysophospholipase L1-like esterase
MDMNDILSAITKKHPDKKIIIFGAGAGGQTLFHSARQAGIDIPYFIDNNKSGQFLFGKPVKSPYDIFYENMDDVLIVIGVCQDFAVTQIKNQLTELGLTEGVNFETPLFNDLYAPLDYIDPLLGYNRMSDLMGFQIFGSPTLGAKKIVVLGGSTTDPSFGGYKSWPECLHEKLAKHGIAATLYNGAIAGYFSALELLKILRDCLQLSPDVIITFDGVNDAIQPMQPGHPMVHPYGKKTFDIMFEATVQNKIDVNVNKEIKGVTYGCENSASRIDFWYSNLRIIKAVCEEFHITFLPFLQPTSLYTSDSADTSDERSLAINSFYQEAAALAKTSGFIIDATSVLDGNSKAYADYVHYTETGNQMIAEFVIRYILSDHGKGNPKQP